MKILLLGGGGREHALAWKMSLAPQTEKIYVTKGANAGLLSFCEDTGIDATDGKALAKFAKENNIQLVMIGPEAPLCAGIANVLRNQGGLTVGGKSAAGSLKGLLPGESRVLFAKGAPLDGALLLVSKKLLAPVPLARGE